MSTIEGFHCIYYVDYVVYNFFERTFQITECLSLPFLSSLDIGGHACWAAGPVEQEDSDQPSQLEKASQLSDGR